MTAKDKSNIIQLINYYDALADSSHKLSRREGLAQFPAGFSSGRCSTFRDVIEHLEKLIEIGEDEV